LKLVSLNIHCGYFKWYDPLTYIVLAMTSSSSASKINVKSFPSLTVHRAALISVS